MALKSTPVALKSTPVALNLREAALMPRQVEVDCTEVRIFAEASIAPKGLAAPIEPLNINLPPATIVNPGNKESAPPSIAPKVTSDLVDELPSRSKFWLR